MDYISVMIFLSKRVCYRLQRYIYEIFLYLSSYFRFSSTLLLLPLNLENFQHKGDNYFEDTL